MKYQPFSETSHQVLDVTKVIELEQQCARGGTPLLTLMERAGTALAQAALELSAAPTHSPALARSVRKAVIFCGSGNNGGDGWVAASYLLEAECNVTLITSRAPQDYSCEPAATAIAQVLVLPCCKALRVLVQPIASEVAAELADADLIIDCILGTGFTGQEVKEPYKSWIKAINASSAYTIACDVPSGMNANNGQVEDVAVAADVTITMLAAKIGLFTTETAAYTGKLYVAPLV